MVVAADQESQRLRTNIGRRDMYRFRRNQQRISSRMQICDQEVKRAIFNVEIVGRHTIVDVVLYLMLVPKHIFNKYLCKQIKINNRTLNLNFY